MTLTLNRNPIIDIHFEGYRVEVPLRQILLDDGADDGEVRRAVAEFLGVSVRRLRGHAVARDEAGNVSVRPRPTFPWN
jgi:hypothetical protein